MTNERRIEVHSGCEAVCEFDPDLTFECVDSCTWCCHHGVLLSDPDLVGLAKRANVNESTTTFRGQRAVQREQKNRKNDVAADGAACFFLRDDGLCELHAEHDWKPVRCSVFPLSVHLEDDDLHISVREEAHDHCEGLDVSERRVIDHLDDFLPEALWSIANPETKIEP